MLHSVLPGGLYFFYEKEVKKETGNGLDNKTKQIGMLLNTF